MLFDAGPEGFIFKENIRRLKLEQALDDVEVVHLSHWHRDHSGGLEEAIQIISKAKSDEHPSIRSCYTPIDQNSMAQRVLLGPSFEADPTFDALELAGGEIVLTSEDHLVRDDLFFVSGSIPRTTSYETGSKGGLRYDSADHGWRDDHLIADERLIMLNLKDKDLVVITGCGHDGVVNTARQAN